MTPEALADALARTDISGRELARRLNVSPMWVSRRLAGTVPITPEDAAAIRLVLDRSDTQEDA